MTGTEHVGARLSADLVKRVDAHKERLAEAHPALGITRTDAIADLLERGLHAVPARGPVRAFELAQPKVRRRAKRPGKAVR
jgi:hypothetical protein